MKRRKPTLKQAISFTQFRKECLEKEFEECSKRLIWQLTQGGGLKNIHILNTIRELDSLYRDVAVHSDALRSLKVDI
jgi:hypothetical protein